jgi:hypothetical protein
MTLSIRQDAVQPLTRRDLLRDAAVGCAAKLLPSVCSSRACASERRTIRRILFTSRGRAAVIDEDGSSERFIAPDVPDQVSWQWGPRFADGRHVVLLSVEGKKTWEHNVRSHLWKYDVDTGVMAHRKSNTTIDIGADD